MIEGPYIAEVAAMMGDPARANMLVALLDGRALTATELAFIGGISKQTASGHLAKLTTAELLAVERQGRHRYYRLADPHVAGALEALSVVAARTPLRTRRTGPRDQAMRHARTCYDHLAGSAAVAMADHMTGQGFLVPDGRDYTITDSGAAFLTSLGIDMAAIRSSRRAPARQCLDWSERRPHVGAALGAALLDRFQINGWITRIKDSRAVTITPDGQAAFTSIFGAKPGGDVP